MTRITIEVQDNGQVQFQAIEPVANSNGAGRNLTEGDLVAVTGDLVQGIGTVLGTTNDGQIRVRTRVTHEVGDDGEMQPSFREATFRFSPEEVQAGYLTQI